MGAYLWKYFVVVTFVVFVFVRAATAVIVFVCQLSTGWMFLTRQK